MTADPVIADGLVDLSFFFDIGAKGERCSLPSTGQDSSFDDKQDLEKMQFVLSDRVVNCMLQALEK